MAAQGKPQPKQIFPVILIFSLISWPRKSRGKKSLLLFLEPRVISKYVTLYLLFSGYQKMPSQNRLPPVQRSGGRKGNKGFFWNLRHSSTLYFFQRSYPQFFFTVGRKRKCLTPQMVVFFCLYTNMPFLEAIWLSWFLSPLFSWFFIVSPYLPGPLGVGMSGVGCGSNNDV